MMMIVLLKNNNPQIKDVVIINLVNKREPFCSRYRKEKFYSKCIKYCDRFFNNVNVFSKLFVRMTKILIIVFFNNNNNNCYCKVYN